MTGCAAGQDASRVIPDPVQTTPPASAQKRVFWFIPNARTSSILDQYKPLTAGQKFKMATDDAFDPGTLIEAALFAGKGQLCNSNPSFGQGAKGYAHRLATSFADFAISDYMTEAVAPSIFHQDPRYFRKGTGSGFSRLGYALAQIVSTHGDSGRRQFNFSEIAGNSAAAGISMAYYPDSRSFGTFAGNAGIQIGLDVIGNVMKEFWPDIQQRVAGKGKN